MRKRNSVKQLNRVASHRKAMMRNMATSLFNHERIVTTRAKGKVLRSYAEKIITRARNSVDSAPEKILHNKREVLKEVKDRDVVVKLFEDIGPRFKDRPGGYIRIIHLPERQSDSARMSIVELVDRKEKTVDPTRASKAARAKSEPVASDDTADKSRKEKSEKKDDKKWYWRFKQGKKKGES